MAPLYAALALSREAVCGCFRRGEREETCYIGPMLSDYRLFFQEFRRNFHSTGSIAPSSRWLAGALSRYVAAGTGPQKILEVGPGTGAVTQRLVRVLGFQDHLDLVELNDSFVQRLRERLETEPSFVAVKDRVRILHQAVETLAPAERYDVIVSGLPLNNFAVADVERILQALTRLLKPQGTLSFFEYVAVRPARTMISGQRERARLKGISRALQTILDQYEVRRDLIWRNFPPAWVHHVRLTPN
jgi:phospholipid N-methyltransferase